MPIYAYLCSQCGKLDIKQPIADQALTSCPLCDTINIKKQYGNVAVAFKGSGFYKTDSREQHGRTKNA